MHILYNIAHIREYPVQDPCIFTSCLLCFCQNFCGICSLNVLPFRNLDNDFLLVRGELQVPFDLVSKDVPYKYIVLRMGRERGEEGKYLWEHIVHAGPYKNRCLCIPKDRCHIGGTCNQLQFQKHILNEKNKAATKFTFEVPSSRGYHVIKEE